MLDKAEDQKERDQKESQEQHSSLADSRMMTISKFAWDEKVEQVRQLREELEAAKWSSAWYEAHVEDAGRSANYWQSHYAKVVEERDKLKLALEYTIEKKIAGVSREQQAASVLSEIKGQGDET